MISMRLCATTVLMLALLGTIAIAQTPGTAFTYQGRLESSGAPTNGSHDMRFSLWLTDNDPNNPIGPVVCKDNVAVSDGLFTTDLDFGTNVFGGFPLWLGIEVRADATPGNCSGGSFTPLAPRQPLKPAPYAVFATTAQTAGLRLPFDGTSASGILFHLTNTSNGQNTSTGFFENYSTGNNSRAFTANANASSGQTYGVYAQCNSTAGYGVYGTSSGVAGVAGVTSASSGAAGVWGLASATSAFSYGVRGESESTNGAGVFGLASATSGDTIGVYGHNASPTGYGAYFVGSRNYFSGSVGIGTSSPASPLELSAAVSGLGSAMYVHNNSTGGAAVFESLGAGSVPAVICYKDDGPALRVISTFTSAGAVADDVPLAIGGGSDTAAAGGGFLVCGPTNGSNLSLDSNEIMARNNGTPGTLALNAEGGNVNILQSGTGNVGIGTNAPAQKLDVNGFIRPRSGMAFNGALPSTSEGQGGNCLFFGDPGVGEDQIMYYGSEGGGFVFWDSPGGGDTSHPYLRAADFVSISDVRLKTNLEPIAGGLNAVRQLQGITYEWDGSRIDPLAGPGATRDTTRHAGFSAQDLARVIPEAVSHDPVHDVYGVSYGSVVPYLVEAIKEQQAQIEALRAEIDALKRRQAE